MSIRRPDQWHEYLLNTLLVGDTRPARLWLAVVNICFCSYLLVSIGSDRNFDMMLRSIPYSLSPAVWICLFLLHAFYLLKGLDGAYNWRTVMLEGVLGWSIWTWTAMTHWLSQGAPGPTFACALMQTWLLVRYPSHWTQWGKRDD